MLEDELDIIADGKLGWRKFLEKFWIAFDQNISQVMKKSIPQVLVSLDKAMAFQVFGVDDSTAGYAAAPPRRRRRQEGA